MQTVLTTDYTVRAQTRQLISSAPQHEFIDHEIIENVALRMTDLGKCYRRYARQWDRIKQWFTLGPQLYYQEHWALRHLNLCIRKGSTVGILGANGSGKSTLLQLIAGTLTPCEGSIHVHGRVAALLELGSGFHPEFTGWENIRLQAGLLGLHADELQDKLPAIAAFSELGDALDRPLRTYSSGMILRLGFSVAINVEPDILLVDEALSVGDMHFQFKCMQRIGQLRERGVSILLVTHDIGTTKRLCDEAHVLHQGELVLSGKTEEVCNGYVARMLAGPGQEQQPNGTHHRHGNRRAVIEHCVLSTAESTSTTQAWIGSTCTIQVKLRFHENIAQPVLGFYLRDRFGTELIGTNTEQAGIAIRGTTDATKTVTFRFGLHVRPGCYTLCVGLVDNPQQPVCLDWIDDAIHLEVHDPIPGRVVHGLFVEEVEVRVT